jgi:cytochrome P450
MATLASIPVATFSWSLEGFVLLGLVGLLTIAASIFLFSRKSFDSQLPPGPTAWPIIGNLHQLGPKNPHHILWEMSKKYGPVMRLWLGSHPLVVVSSAQAAAEFVKVQDKAWGGRPPSIAGEIFSYNYRNVVWAPYGNYWRHVRKICSLELLTPKRLETFRAPRAEELSQMIKTMFQDGEKGEAVNLQVKLGHLSSNNITRMLLNKRFFDADTAGEEDSHRFTELIFEVFSISLTLLIGDFIPWLKWVTTVSGFKARIKKAKGGLDSFLQTFLEIKKSKLLQHQIQKKPQASGTNEEEHADEQQQFDQSAEEDFVGVLMAQPSEDGTGRLAEDSVKAVIQDLLLAGTDTSALTVEWGLAELLRNPIVMKKLQNELDTVVGKDRIVMETDLPNLPYLQAVAKEVFRLHPTTPLGIPHESMEPTTVLGFKFPTKTRLFLNLYAIQRDPMMWERPLEFDPERFVKNPEIDVRGKHLQLMPFGTGRRMCPGMPLAVVFVQMGLARLAHSFDFTLPGGEDPLKLDMTETFGLSTPRVHPLHVHPKPRLPKHLYL